MIRWLVLALAMVGCTGDVDVHGVPKTIKIVWPDCEPGEHMFCTKVDAGTDGAPND